MYFNQNRYHYRLFSNPILEQDNLDIEKNYNNENHNQE